MRLRQLFDPVKMQAELASLKTELWKERYNIRHYQWKLECFAFAIHIFDDFSGKKILDAVRGTGCYSKYVIDKMLL